MTAIWTGWKRFPDAENSSAFDAPMGPGVYEVRHALSGRVIAFGWACNVARTLAELESGTSGRRFMRLFGKQTLPRRVDLEYRTCGATNRSEAQIFAQRLLGMKKAAWTRPLPLGNHWPWMN